MKRFALIFIVAAAALLSQPSPRELVGPRPDGSFLLSSGWRIKAAGTQIPVDTFPMAALVTPDRKFLLVLNGGYNPPSLSVIDIASGKAVGKTPVPDAWLGLTMTKAGDKVYVGGGSRASIYEFSFANGVLTPRRVFPIVAEKDRKPEDFIGDVQFSPDGHLLYAANVFRDSVVVVNPQSGLVLSRFKTGRRPYRILFHPSGKSLYVSSWADGAVSQYDASSGMQIATVRVGAHPTDMAWREGTVEDHPEIAARLFVSAANTNNVFVLSATESGDLARLETINLAMTPLQPLGSTPGGLGLSDDGSRLFVACADANAVAIVDISGPRGRVAGFVPAGWYPTAAFGLPDGRMGVLNGKSNSLQLVDVSDESKLDGFTGQVLANTPYNDEKLQDAGIPAGNPVRPNGPIKHVIYIVKESRTYDQVLGDMKEGNGDPSRALFGERDTPNFHKIAREFVLLDNFYVNSDRSADGHNWVVAAIAPDFTQRLGPSQAAGRRQTYDFEGGEPANSPPAGYLWSNAAQAGISMRNYGYFAENLPKAEPDGTQIAGVRDPILARYTNPKFRSFDPDYPDVDRAKVFLDDLAGFDKSGVMPQLLILRLGNDRTSGTTPGKIAPLAASADNDQAIGMLAEGVSKSRFWNDTAIFVIEDDAANGTDHVDPHRSTCYVISPWVKRHAVDSTLYNQASVLRTMEIILGMHPMTTYDAGARPMFAVFDNAASGGPYALEKPRVPLDTRNPAQSPN